MVDSSSHKSGFHRDTVLKSDVFSTIERGRFMAADGVSHPAVRRDASLARWWCLPLAKHFLKREKRGLERVRGLGIAPELLGVEDNAIVRSWLEGLPMQMAKPAGRADTFRSARRALLLCHRAGVAHNDLAKEPNWLISSDGRAYLTDFQLASVHRRRRKGGRSKLFRVLAYEDLRHLLKHKRKYAPEAVTASETRILARKSLFTRIWMQTGKRIYRWVTRGLLGVRDREGGGLRLAHDGPLIVAALKAAGARDAAVVAFPYPRRGIGLYAFAEGLETAMTDTAVARLPVEKRPEKLQVVDVLPRASNGEIRLDALALVATNQVDLVDALVRVDPELEPVMIPILAGRLNLADRT